MFRSFYAKTPRAKSAWRSNQWIKASSCVWSPKTVRRRWAEWNSEIRFCKSTAKLWPDSKKTKFTTFSRRLTWITSFWPYETGEEKVSDNNQLTETAWRNISSRPFERTVTLTKDSSNHLGFKYKDGKITAIAVNTSAGRNGLLIDHNLLEVEKKGSFSKMKTKFELYTLRLMGKTWLV